MWDCNCGWNENQHTQSRTEFENQKIENHKN